MMVDRCHSPRHVILDLSSGEGSQSFPYQVKNSVEKAMVNAKIGKMRRSQEVDITDESLSLKVENNSPIPCNVRPMKDWY
jgi:hypothetical protein